MTPGVRNRLLILGAVVNGAAGTFVVGRRAPGRPSNRKGVGATALRGVAVGAVQGLIAGVLVALLPWAVTISGFTLQDPVELPVLMSPRILLGSFFVALSALAYTLVCGILLGPIFGLLVERVTIKEKELVR